MERGLDGWVVWVVSGNLALILVFVFQSISSMIVRFENNLGQAFLQIWFYIRLHKMRDVMYSFRDNYGCSAQAHVSVDIGTRN